MSKEEIVNALQSWIAEDDFTPNKEKLDEYQTTYSEIVEKAKNEQLSAFIEGGGDETEFTYSTDELDTQYKDSLSAYHEKRKDIAKQKAAEESNNLAVKKNLLIELKELITDEENIAKAYKRFNAVKQKWNETGPAPNSDRRDLQAEYSRLIEQFYYNINIYRELQINDLKKNQELKMEIIEKIKKLGDEKSINQLDFFIHQYLDEWDEIGPTFREEWDKIREEFKEAVGKVFERIREHRGKVRDQHQQSFDKKMELVNRVKEIAEQSLDEVKQVQKLTKQVIDTQKEWKGLGFAGRGKNDKVWAQFRAACDAYFAKRSEFLNKSNADFQKVKEVKAALIAKAKEIHDGDDFGSIANQLKGLQREWKMAGKLLPQDEFRMFKEFRKYCDSFFNRRKQSFADREKAEKESLNQKEELLMRFSKELEKGIKDEQQVNLWREEWLKSGEVAPKMKAKTESAFDSITTKAYQSLGISRSDMEERKFETNLVAIGNQEDAEDSLRIERSRILEKIKEAKSEMIQLENKLDFFTFSDDTNPLKKELLDRISDANQKVEALKEKKKRIDLMMKQKTQAAAKNEEVEEESQSE